MKLEKPFTLKEISSIIKAKPVGLSDFLITGINEIHKVEKILEKASDTDKQKLRLGELSIHNVYTQIKRQEN